MKHENFFLISVILLSVLSAIALCTKSDPGLIDKQYLHSQGYIEFSQKTAKESRQKAEQIKSVQKFFQNSVRCKKKLKLLAIPITIDQQKLDALQKETSQKCEYQVGNMSPKMTVQLLAKHSLKNSMLQWVLVNHNTIYKDQELLLAIYKSGTFSELKKVGVFQKNISREITSKITVQKRVGGLRITTISNRKIIYPIEQTNIVETTFQVTEGGKIVE